MAQSGHSVDYSRIQLGLPEKRTIKLEFPSPPSCARDPLLTFCMDDSVFDCLVVSSFSFLNIFEKSFFEVAIAAAKAKAEAASTALQREISVPRGNTKEKNYRY